MLQADWQWQGLTLVGLVRSYRHACTPYSILWMYYCTPYSVHDLIASIPCDFLVDRPLLRNSRRIQLCLASLFATSMLRLTSKNSNSNVGSRSWLAALFGTRTRYLLRIPYSIGILSSLAIPLPLGIATDGQRRRWLNNYNHNNHNHNQIMIWSNSISITNGLMRMMRMCCSRGLATGREHPPDAT